MHGIPVLVKDNFETAGLATSFGSIAFSPYVPGARPPSWRLRRGDR
jgi:Asp-tRNA(Asn)/Glu-tRNA(Gln) amidotransferase A subunit family amidase